jgi:hypothetical protein
MSQSSPRSLGMDVHQETSAVASGAQDHGAAVPFRGPLGTRQGDLEQRLRTRQPKAQHLVSG